MKNLCSKLAHALNDYMYGKGDYELSNQLVKEAISKSISADSERQTLRDLLERSFNCLDSNEDFDLRQEIKQYFKDNE